MNTNKSKRKNVGPRSKKANRVLRAKIRLEAYNKLSPAEKEAQKAANKAAYDAQKKHS